MVPLRFLLGCLALVAATALSACNDPPGNASTNVVVQPPPDPEPTPSGDPAICGGEKPIKTGDGRYICP